MKSLISALLAFMLATPTWGEEITEKPQPVGAETSLNIATHYLDSLFQNALNSLELIASTPEAKSGDWNGIKPYLKQLKANLPGVYFFVLPNGNYYSVDLDYTNLNLSNRHYFDSLFAGNTVKGSPIYSRSSGKKSALVGAPIEVSNKVTGALGISIFLDELVAKLDQVIALPKSYNWFVLNSDATDMLDRDRDFIFMNVFKQGSPSMREAITRALASESGTIEYELERPRRGHYRKLPNLDWWMFLVKIEGEPTQTPAQLTLSLERFVPVLQERLEQIDHSLAKLIETSKVDIDHESDIRKLLNNILEKNLPIVEAAFIDTKGVMRYIEPPEYSNFENMDLSSQDHIISMQKNPTPQFSDGFMTVERFLAVIIAHPIYDKEGSYSGYINLVIRPKLLIEPLLKTSTIPDDFELWIMQPNGMIIYDQDKEEIGKMLFSDPLYTSHETLLALGKQIASASSGEGTYIFLAPELTEKVIKKAVWRTVRLHGQEWRVVLAYRPYE